MLDDDDDGDDHGDDNVVIVVVVACRHDGFDLGGVSRSVKSALLSRGFTSPANYFGYSGTYVRPNVGRSVVLFPIDQARLTRRAVRCVSTATLRKRELSQIAADRRGGGSRHRGRRG